MAFFDKPFDPQVQSTYMQVMAQVAQRRQQMALAKMQQKNAWKEALIGGLGQGLGSAVGSMPGILLRDMPAQAEQTRHNQANESQGMIQSGLQADALNQNAAIQKWRETTDARDHNQKYGPAPEAVSSFASTMMGLNGSEVDPGSYTPESGWVGFDPSGSHPTLKMRSTNGLANLSREDLDAVSNLYKQGVSAEDIRARLQLAREGGLRDSRLADSTIGYQGSMTDMNRGIIRQNEEETRLMEPKIKVAQTEAEAKAAAVARDVAKNISDRQVEEMKIKQAEFDTFMKSDLGITAFQTLQQELASGKPLSDQSKMLRTILIKKGFMSDTGLPQSPAPKPGVLSQGVEMLWNALYDIYGTPYTEGK